MASEREDFSLSGPLHLTCVNWMNADHRRTVAACLVQGVYSVERDRRKKHEGSQALAPPWWEFFHFEFLHRLVDRADPSIFGAIYEYKPPSHYNDSIKKSPRYVIAFRGTMFTGFTFSRDLKLDFRLIRNGLHQTSRFEIGMQAVQSMVAAFGDSNVWLAGHSLGAAMAMLAGKTMAKTGLFLESFLFNPPFPSAPIEGFKNTIVKDVIRIAGSVITAELAPGVKAKNQNQRHLSEDPFAALSAWLPCLFVNPADHICSEYLGYFEHRRKMEEIGAGHIEKLATQHSLVFLLISAVGKGEEAAEPFHLIPSANLTVNQTPTKGFKKGFKNAHGIHQWWRPDQELRSKLYRYT